MTQYTMFTIAIGGGQGRDSKRWIWDEFRIRFRGRLSVVEQSQSESSQNICQYVIMSKREEEEENMIAAKYSK